MKFHRSLSLFLLFVGTALIVSAQDAKDQAQSFAEEVLGMKDSKQFQEMYREKFHSSLKQQMTEPQWIAAATQVAQQTGDNQGRTLSQSDEKQGVYMFRYDSTYENGSAYDDVYVVKQGGGWKVVGIWVRPRQ